MTFTQVIGIETQGNKIKGVHTDRGYISTPIVVNAAGGLILKKLAKW